MPPEQVGDAKRVDPRADLYALGATLYHLLAGRPPFAPRDVAELFATLDQQPTPVTELRPDCPPALAELVGQLLAKDPADRPPNARRVARGLAAIRAGLDGA